MAGWRLGVITAFVVGIMGAGLFMFALIGGPWVSYRGEVTFNTSQEFQEFKWYIGDPEVQVQDLEVLGGEVPIWVRYRMVVPRGMEFPYPYDGVAGYGNSGLLVVAALMMVLGFGIGLERILLNEKKEEIE